MTSARAILDAAMTEAELQEAIIERFDQFGWTWMHIPDRLYGMAAQQKRFDAMVGAKGFPDLLALHPDGVLLVIECKTEDGMPTPEQEEWLRLWGIFLAELWKLIPARYHEAMLDRMLVAIWRPRDLSSGVIDEITTRQKGPHND